MDFPTFDKKISEKLDSDSSPLGGHTFFGPLSINASLKTPLLKHKQTNQKNQLSQSSETLKFVGHF